MCFCGALTRLGAFLMWDNDPRVDNGNATKEQDKTGGRHRWEKGGKRSLCMGSLCFCYYLPTVADFYLEFSN